MLLDQGLKPFDLIDRLFLTTICIYILLYGLRRKLQGTHGQNILFVPHRIALLKFFDHLLDLFSRTAQPFFLGRTDIERVNPVCNR